MTGPQIELRERLPHQPRSATTARAVVDRRLASELDADTLRDVRLLVTELVTNALRHVPEERRGDIELRVGLWSRLLRVEVRDRGPGFEPQPRQPDSALDSGWGLHLVEMLADRWGVACERGNCVWFEIELPRSATTLH